MHNGFEKCFELVTVVSACADGSPGWIGEIDDKKKIKQKTYKKWELVMVTSVFWISATMNSCLNSRRMIVGVYWDESC